MLCRLARRLKNLLALLGLGHSLSPHLACAVSKGGKPLLPFIFVQPKSLRVGSTLRCALGEAQPLMAMLRARMPDLTAKGGYDVCSISCYAILSATPVPA